MSVLTFVRRLCAQSTPNSAVVRAAQATVEQLEGRTLLSTVIYDRNFTDDLTNGAKVPGLTINWNKTSKTTSPSGNRFLGEFNRETVTLTLGNLGAHDTLHISFDVYFLRSWDGEGTGQFGPDSFRFIVGDGAPLLDATFRNVQDYAVGQSFGGQDKPLGLYNARTGADTPANSLGYEYRRANGEMAPADSVYHFTYVIDHTAATLLLKWSGLPNQGMGDESWGLDNIMVQSGMPTLDTLWAADADAQGGGTATATMGATVTDLYLRENADGKGLAQFDVTTLPNAAGQKDVIHWKITTPPDGATPDKTEGRFNDKGPISLTLARDNFDTKGDAILEAGFDTNRSGLLDAGEVLRTIKLHVLPFVEVKAVPEQVRESDRSAAFEITRSGSLDHEFTVDLEVAGTAVEGKDYTGWAQPTLARQMPFNQNVPFQTLTWYPVDDGIVEPGGRTVILKAVDRREEGLYLAVAPAQALLLDPELEPNPDGSKKPRVVLVATQPSASESPDPAHPADGPKPAELEFRVSRGPGDTQPVNVRFKAVFSDPVTAGDFTIAGAAALGNNEYEVAIAGDEAVVKVVPVDDAILEDTESLNLELLESNLYSRGGSAATVTISDNDVDIDVDSNNNGNIDGDNSGNGTDDPIEDRSDLPGQFLSLNDGDVDFDGIVDWADGFLLYTPLPDTATSIGAKFTPVVITVNPALDLSTAKFKLDYDGSDPSAVSRSGTGSPFDPYVYNLPTAGKVRLWRRDGSVSRNMASVGAGGDWIKPNEELTAAQLGLNESSRTVIIFVEAVKGSSAKADIRLKLVVDRDGTASSIDEDAVRLTALKADLGFNNNNSAASDPQNKLRDGTPDAAFVIDDADDRTEEVGTGFEFWLSHDEVGATGPDTLPDLIPFTVTIPEATFLAGGFFTLRMEYIGPDDNLCVYLYPNVSPSSDRLKYLSDATTSAQQIAKLADPTGDIRDQTFMSRNANELYLHYFRQLQAGSNEFLLRIKSSDVARVKFSLLWVSPGESNKIVLDNAVVTVQEATEYYSVASARGTQQSPITSPSVPFTYRTEGGRTELIDSYPYQLTRDRHDLNVSKTLVYVHGYNNNYDDAEKAFSEVYKRLYLQGFRGNFVGFSWHGNEDAPGFDPNVKNAFQTSPSLWMFLRNVLENDTGVGGWGLRPEDVDIAAHSLGNQVMWDAIRLNGRIVPGEKLVNNVTSIEAAVWSEAFAPAGDVVYSGSNWDITYTSDQLEKMSWHHWFNPADMNIKSSIAGKVFNSFHNQDEALLVSMRLNDILSRPSMQFTRSEWDYRAPSNFLLMSALMLPGHRSPIYDANALSLPIGAVPMPIADRNVDASLYGWDNTDGMGVPGTGDSGHSDHTLEPYIETFSWWRHLFAGDGNPAWSAVAIGEE